MYLQSLVEYIYKFIKTLYVKLDVLKILRILFCFVFYSFSEEQENKKKKASINVCDSKLKNLLLIWCTISLNGTCLSQ